MNAGSNPSDTPAGELLDLLRSLPGQRVPRGVGLMALGGVGGYEGEITVDLDEEFAGRPARETRDLLKQHAMFGIQIRDVTRPLNLDARAAEAFLRKLVAAGLLKRPDGTRSSRDGRFDYRTWTLTSDGHTLASASGRTPSSRRNAEALSRKVVRAVATVNADPDATLWWVQEIRAVGAFADPDASSVLHLDLAVRLRPRLDDPAEQAKAERRMRDDAEDCGDRARVWDMVGYGHWRTRLALAGRSKVIRLWTWEPDVAGILLFREERDLTVHRSPTPPYERPAEPAVLPQCSWCRRPEPSAPVAVKGQSWSRSSTGLCMQCMALSGTEETRFGWISNYGAIKTALTALAEQPFHQSGCALCGHTASVRAPRWPDHSDVVPVDLDLCSVCVGLLQLVDEPGRPRHWVLQHQDACLTGMHARLTRADREDAAPARKTPARRSRPRLADPHRTVLAALGGCGALRAVDLARDPSTLRHQDSRWWTVRIAHLLDHELVTFVGDDPGYLDNAVLRLQDDEERDLARACQDLHRPGPAWNGAEVAEPEAPAEWRPLHHQLTVLRRERDQQALHQRAAAGLDPLPA